MSNTLQAFVHTLRYEAQDTISVELRPVDGGEFPAFTAGSHIDLHLPNGLVRSYSLSNDSSERHRYVVGVLRDRASRGGSRCVHESLRVGMPITISEPRNHFALDEAATHSVLVASRAYLKRHPAPQHPEGRDGEGGILWLIAANERQPDAVQSVKVEGNGVEAPPLHVQAGEIHHREGGVLFFRRPGDDGVRLRHTAVAHHRTARLDDAGLGGGDVRDGGAEFFYMVHAQRRDDRALGRVDDVG